MVNILSIEGKPVYKLYEFVVDEADDLSDLGDFNPAPGSTVKCIENSLTYMLDGSGVWSPVNFIAGQTPEVDNGEK